MSSVIGSVRKRKKSRVLGEVEVVNREAYQGLDLDAKVEMIRALVPLGLMHVEELLDAEVVALAGERYTPKEEPVRGRRHGSNPGTVRLAGQRVPMRIPRVRGIGGGEIPLRSYDALHRNGEVDEHLLRRVLYGISCNNYEAAAEAIPGAIGLSGSTVSRRFVEASAAKLGELQERGFFRGRRRGDVRRREDVRGRDHGGAAGSHPVGGEAVSGLRGDRYGECAGPDSVSAFSDRTGSEHRAGHAGDHRRGQRPAGGGEPGVPRPGAGAALSVALRRCTDYADFVPVRAADGGDRACEVGIIKAPRGM